MASCTYVFRRFYRKGEVCGKPSVALHPYCEVCVCRPTVQAEIAESKSLRQLTTLHCVSYNVAQRQYRVVPYGFIVVHSEDSRILVVGLLPPHRRDIQPLSEGGRLLAHRLGLTVPESVPMEL